MVDTIRYYVVTIQEEGRQRDGGATGERLLSYAFGKKDNKNDVHQNVCALLAPKIILILCIKSGTLLEGNQMLKSTEQSNSRKKLSGSLAHAR